MKLRIILSLCCGLLPLSCGTTVDDIQSTYVSSNVAVTDENGVVTATLPTDSQSLVVASKDAASTESYITVPAGTLAIATEVSLGDATDLSTNILAATGVDTTNNAVAKTTAPFFAGPTGSPTALSAGSIAISLPLPVASPTSLTATEGKLVFLYLIYTKDGYRAGMKALSAANLVGTFARVDIQGFGYFQLAFLAKAVADVEDVEYTGTSLPTLAK